MVGSLGRSNRRRCGGPLAAEEQVTGRRARRRWTPLNCNTRGLLRLEYPPQGGFLIVGSISNWISMQRTSAIFGGIDLG